jgi:hypothetical protein
MTSLRVALVGLGVRLRGLGVRVAALSTRTRRAQRTPSLRMPAQRCVAPPAGAGLALPRPGGERAARVGGGEGETLRGRVGGAGARTGVLGSETGRPVLGWRASSELSQGFGWRREPYATSALEMLGGRGRGTGGVCAARREAGSEALEVEKGSCEALEVGADGCGRCGPCSLNCGRAATSCEACAHTLPAGARGRGPRCAAARGASREGPACACCPCCAYGCGAGAA